LYLLKTNPPALLQEQEDFLFTYALNLQGFENLEGLIPGKEDRKRGI